ncbi:ELL-associated factor 2 [Halotydeus destructor]|nr:ELL-associated factor 2 [Halotydeus destructor]
MSSVNIVERLGFKDGETRDLKLGKSFKNFKIGHSNDSFSNGPGDSYHSIRYDFKPASVDSAKMAQIEFGQNNKVTVIAPNVEGSGQAETVYKGSRKPHLKECVLVIDHETGEITLERLSNQIIVKKTRAEGSSRASQLSQLRPPSPEVNGKRSPARGSGGKASHKAANRGGHQSNTKAVSPSVSSSSSSHILSMPNSLTAITNSVHDARSEDVAMLSASSSDSESDESSSSDEDETARQLESSLTGDLTVPTAAPVAFHPSKVEQNTNAASPSSAMSDSSDSNSSSSSSSEDSDDDDDNAGKNNVVSPAASSNGHSNSSLSMPNFSTTLSMPNFTQLSHTSRQVTPPLSNGSRPPSTMNSSVLSVLPKEDLRLSESDSDSD